MLALPFLSAILLAGSVVAIPGAEPLAARVASQLPRSQPLLPFAGDSALLRPHAAVSAPIPQNRVNYTGNWAGAAYALPRGSVKSVRGTIVIPTINIPPSGNPNQTYWASAWVGIDGSSCHTANSLWQAGFYFTIQGTTRAIRPWYVYLSDGNVHEDWPSGSVAFNPGDTVTMSVTANSPNNGTAVIENTTSGQTLTATLANEAVLLCLQDAEWIIEDFETQAFPLADYGTVTFSNTFAVLGNGSTIRATGADIIETVDNNGPASSVTVDAKENTVTVSYV